tara:strand:- start:404 stop:868 length:465 start_codon:yes stop_codon:yes gene_type:complete
MAFKQRSEFKAKEGGAAFKQMGSSKPSPHKFLGKIGKAIAKGTKFMARNSPIGLGVRAAKGEFSRGGGGEAASGEAIAPGEGGFELMSNEEHKEAMRQKMQNMAGMGGMGGGGMFGMLGGLPGGFFSRLKRRGGGANPLSDTGSAMAKKSKYNK